MTKDEKLIAAEALMTIATRMLSEATDPKPEQNNRANVIINALETENNKLQQEIVGLRSQLEYFSTVKDGFVVVPKYPTSEMCDAMRAAVREGWIDAEIWRAAIRAVK